MRNIKEIIDNLLFGFRSISQIVLEIYQNQSLAPLSLVLPPLVIYESRSSTRLKTSVDSKLGIIWFGKGVTGKCP